MSCDIHGYIEIKERPEASWEALIVAHTIVPKHYALFAKLFGVRNGPMFPVNKERAAQLGIEPGWYQKRIEPSPVAPDRGIPQDADWTTQEAYWGEDFYKVVNQEGESGGPDPRRIEGVRDWHSPSWLLASELSGIDWTATADYEDPCVRAYRRGEDGALSPADLPDPDRYLFRRWEERLGAFREQGARESAPDAEAQIAEMERLLIHERGQEVELDGYVFRGEQWTWGDLRDRNWRDLFWLLGVLSERYGAEQVRMVVWFDN